MIGLRSIGCMVVLVASTAAPGQEKKPAVKEIDAGTIAVYKKLGAEYGGWVKSESIPDYDDFRRFPMWFVPAKNRDDHDYPEVVLPGFTFKKFPMAKLPRVAVPFGLTLEGATDADLAELDALDNLVLLNLVNGRYTAAGLKELAGFDKLASLQVDALQPAGIKVLAEFKGLTCLEVGSIQSVEARDALADLTNLRELYLPGTNLQPGTIKRLAGLKRLETLQFSNVSSRQSLEILSEVGLLHAMPGATAKNGTRPKSADDVVSLRIGGHLTPEQMEKLLVFKNLTSLRLYNLGFWNGGNQDFSYKTPADLLKDVARFENLIELDLSNQLAFRYKSGCLQELAGLKHLASLNLGGMNLSRAAVKEVATLANLRALGLAGAEISDKELMALAVLAKLRALDLHGTQVTNAGMKHVAQFKNLTTLDLGKTRVRDFGVKELAGLADLTALDLSDTEVTDAALRELVGLKKLATLNLVGTRTTDAGIAELQKALPNCKVER